MSKNIIKKISSNIITKEFTDLMAFHSELTFYQEFYYFSLIPKIIKYEENKIFLEFIDGESLYDISNEKRILLANSIAQMHNLTYNEETKMCITHYDTNLKNYIYYREKIFILDFAEITLGSPLSDLYSILLFFCDICYPDCFWLFVDDFIQLYKQTVSFSIYNDLSLFNAEVENMNQRRSVKNILPNERFNENYRILNNKLCF